MMVTMLCIFKLQKNQITVRIFGTMDRIDVNHKQNVETSCTEEMRAQIYKELTELQQFSKKEARKQEKKIVNF